MIRRAIRSSVTALAVAFFAVPQVSLAQAANDQAQVDPLMQKAARIQAMNAQMRVTHAQRVEAAKALKAEVERVKAAKAAARAKGIEVPELGIRGTRAVKAGMGSTQTHARGAVRSTSATALPTPEGTPPGGVGPLDIPDYNTTANWAFSPMLKKFVHSLPGLGAGGANDLGQYIPMAHPDTVTYPGSDYYEISLRLYTWQFGGEKYDGTLLPATNVRGYVQTNDPTAAGGQGAIGWLGPVIIAQKDRPVRVKFKNELPSGEGGNLIIPVDESIMGSGKGASFPDGSVCDPSPPGVNLYGQDCALYPQSRSAIHLHGGRTPWISDGTPHQWILPIGDYNNPLNPYKQGVSLANVPDMPVPGPDETTYYWTNQQSARLMFYHDHAWGITRLNVMSGEAAGLLITDQTEQDLIAEGILPGVGTPLVIQDRTFVDAARIRLTDPTWNSGSGTPDVNGIRPPVDGDFWLPHVYVPAQNPYMDGGVNPFGRWVYGPWFFPPTANLFYPPVPNPYHDPNCSDPDPAVLAFCTTPGQPPVIPGTPTPSVGAETFFDTVIVNGQVYPYMDVEPKAYRFRILNAANDRFFNLNLYEADTLQVAHAAGGGVTPSNTEVEMCATPGPIPAATPICWSEAQFPNWPKDGRVEGVPNPNRLGPDIVYIGTEGGFLPKPVILTGQPMTWVGDPTAFNVGNVDQFNLFVGPAERADVIIDFTNWAGKTLIFYNDAPAAVPAFDPRFGYTTGAEDLSANGGYGMAPPWSTTGELEGPQIGYGPNVRAVMQFRVGSAVTGANTFNLANLQARWMPGTTPAGRTTPLGVFEQAQDQIIVGQADYDGVYTSNPSFPSVWPAWGVSRIEDNTLMFETVSGSIVTFPMEPKAMHDEMGASFDKEYARMSTNLGVQRPIPQTNNANMTPMMYPDPATEILNAALEPVSATLGDGTQLWKISHNGVDMHPIHFHIFDVQVINRVGWDGQIRLPAPQELGWKDTVRIAPLEDTIVAMRPWTPPLPFAIPYSLRALNPAIPIGSGFGFTNIDPVTQQPIVPPVTNQITDFAWEYVWHCHILSHEENDMMRPIVLNVMSSLPPAPAAPTVVPQNDINVGPLGNRVTWIDPTPVNYVTQAGFSGVTGGVNVNNLEIGFRIERATSATGAYITVGTARANQTTFLDTSRSSATTYYRYRVVPFNEAGSTPSPFTSINNPTTPSITSVAVAVNNTSTPAGITTTTWTKNLTSIVTPNFRATPNPTSAQAEYRFSLRTGASPAPYVLVQDWSPSRDWVMPAATVGTVAGQAYSVQVEARTSNAVTAPIRIGTRAYTVRIPSPATALVVIPDIASPVEVGGNVLFTATATGGAAAKQYQFLLDGVVVQPWSAVTTWTLPGLTPVGTYTVTAQVRTNTGAIDQTANSVFSFINPLATGVTLALQGGVTNPGPAPVSFLATGQGPLPLTIATGGGYFYRFLVNGVEVKPYSTSRVFTLPASTPAGVYTVRVEVRTSTFTAADAAAEMTYTVDNGATVSFTSISPASPGTYGTPVTFTATGAGGVAPVTYQYRFTLDGGTPTGWSTTNTFVMPGTTLAGSHTVLVEVSTAATPVAAMGSASTTYQVNYPSLTAVSLGASPAAAAAFGAPVVFTASGVVPAGLPAGAVYYRFMNGLSVLQDWSTSATFTSSALALGTYSVTVEASTAASGWTAQATSAAVAYEVYAAVGVSFSSITPASPQLAGTAVTFTAAGSGGPSGATYSYQFTLDGGTPTAWSTTPTYVMPNMVAPGAHTVSVDVTIEPVPATVQAAASTSYTLNVPSPATGLTFSSITPPSPGPASTASTFVAQGTGGTGTYFYRFRTFNYQTNAWTEVVPYGTTNSYTLPADAGAGQYQVLVQVTTNPAKAAALGEDRRVSTIYVRQ